GGRGVRRWQAPFPRRHPQLPLSVSPDTFSATAHPFTPAPGRGGVSVSRGHRGLSGASRPSTRPSRSRSMPAQAIIAPLSVHKAGGGATRRNPVSSARPLRHLRSLLLAATPPPTTSEFPFGYLRRNHATAFAVRSVTASQIASSTEAARSAWPRGSRGPRAEVM